MAVEPCSEDASSKMTMPPTADPSSSVIVPVATICEPRLVGIVRSLLTADWRVSVSSSLGSMSLSPLISTITVAEAAPAAIVPAKASGSAGAPAKSAESAATEAISPVKSTAPVVPPVRSTVKEKLVEPLLPSRRVTVTEAMAKATVCVSAIWSANAVVEKGRSGGVPSAD